MRAFRGFPSNVFRGASFWGFEAESLTDLYLVPDEMYDCGFRIGMPDAADRAYLLKKRLQRIELLFELHFPRMNYNN